MKLTDLPPVFDTNVQPLKPEDVARIIRDLDKEAAKTGYENKWAKPYGMRDLSGEFPGMSPQMARLLASRGQSAQTAVIAIRGNR